MRFVSDSTAGRRVLVNRRLVDVFAWGLQEVRRNVVLCQIVNDVDFRLFDKVSRSTGVVLDTFALSVEMHRLGFDTLLVS